MNFLSGVKTGDPNNSNINLKIATVGRYIYTECERMNRKLSVKKFKFLNDDKELTE